MENQKILDLLDNTPNQSSKFRIRNWVERNYRSRGTLSNGGQIRFKTSVLRSSLCVYTYILVSWTTTVTGEGADDVVKRKDESDKGVVCTIY